MNSIANQLPPEIARQLHPDRRKNEEDYWASRDQLLSQYQGQWIGFAGGKVIAAGTSPVTVFEAAEGTGLHPFLICVGEEDQPCRVRRAAFQYDSGYRGEPLPLVSVEFRKVKGLAGVVLDRVIPDTGGGCQRLAVGGLPTLTVESILGSAGPAQRSCRQFDGNARLSGLGRARRPGIPVPGAGGLCRQRAHPGT